MVFEKVTIDNSKKLEIPVNLHQYTWDYYLNQYATALSHIINVSLKKEYRLDRMQMAVMFIFRHTIELFLKKELYNTGNTVPVTHDLNLLAKELDDKDILSFLNNAAILAPQSEGDCFKYIDNREGKKHFRNEILDVLPLISSFISLPCIKSTSLGNSVLDVNAKVLRHEWSFYTIETKTLGHIKTQYDFLISSILNSIKNDEMKIEQVYLPLLFLIRHSLEVGFKDNISEVFDSLTNSQKRKYCSKHSLEALLNIAIQFVEEAQKNFTSLEHTIQKEIAYYRPITELLMKNMHELDNRSLSFRFPVDENGDSMNIPFSRNVLSDAVTAYQTADSFISLSISVLKYEGYL